MIVKELIDKLKELDEEAIVIVEDSEYGCFDAIDVIADNVSVLITTSIKD